MKKSVLLTSLFAFSCLTSTIEAASGSWNITGDGTWNTNANWSVSPFPNAAGETATFPNVTSGNAAKTVNISATLPLLTAIGTISFTNTTAQSYTINATTPQLINLAGAGVIKTANSTTANLISAPINLVVGANIDVNGTAGVLTISGIISGSNGISKTSEGTLRLSASNTYTGPTKILDGKIDYLAVNAIPGNTLVTIGDTGPVYETLTISANMGLINAFDVQMTRSSLLEQTPGNNIFIKSLESLNVPTDAPTRHAEVKLATSGSQSLQIIGNATKTFFGRIIGGATGSDNNQTGNYFLVTGGGTLTLSGTDTDTNPNTYLSRTFVTGGSTVVIGKSSALGAAGAGSAAYAHGTGTYKLDNTQISPTGLLINKAFFLNGNGASGVGAIHNFKGNNTISGLITLGWTSTTPPVTAAPTTFNIEGGTTLTLSGIISGTALLNSSLTKTGEGRLVLSASNTYKGPTKILDGSIDYAAINAIPANTLVTIGDSGPVYETLRILAPMSASNAFSVEMTRSATLEQTPNNNIFITSLESLDIPNNAPTRHAEVKLATSGSQSLQIIGNATKTFFGRIIGGATGSDNNQTGNYFLVTGGGTLTLSGTDTDTNPNTYTSRTFVTGGSTVVIGKSSALGAAGATSGAYAYGSGTYKLDNTQISPAGLLINKAFFLSGGGAADVGALYNFKGNNTISGAIALGYTSTSPVTAPVTINVEGSTLLTLSGAISSLNNTFSLTKIGGGELKLTATNSYNSPTFINDGTLTYGANGAIPSTSSVTVGDGSDPAGSAVLQFTSSVLAPNYITLTDIKSDGKIFQGPGASVRIDRLTGIGSVVLDSATTGLDAFNIIGTGAASTSTYSGLISGGTQIPSSDSTVGNCLIVEGNTTLTLPNANTYASRTFVRDGSKIIIGNPKSLGNNPLDAPAGSAAFANSTGTFEFATTGFTIPKPFALNGSGVGGIGAIHTTSTALATKLSGPITLGFGASPADATFGVDGGTLNTLTLSGHISGPKGLTKIEAGTLSLSGNNNNYAGSTIINAGLVDYLADGTIPSASPVTIDIGATLQISVNMTNPNALTITAIDGTLLQGPNSIVNLKNLFGTGTIQLDNGASTSRPFNIVGTAGPYPSTYNGQITGGFASPGNNSPTSGSALVISGNQTITLPNANTYVARTFVTDSSKIIFSNAGALGTGAAYTYSGGSFEPKDLAATNTNAFLLNGSGNSIAGALVNNSGNNTLWGPITIGWSNGSPVINPSDVTIGVTGGMLTLSGALGGTNNLTKIGSGPLRLTGTTANSYGNTTLSAGSLQLGKTAGVAAIPNNVLIQTGGTLEMLAANQFGDTSVMTIDGGTYDMHGNAQTIYSVIFNSGTMQSTSGPPVNNPPAAGNITTVPGLFQITGGSSVPPPLGITLSSGTSTLKFLANGANSSTISAINLGATNRTIDVEDGGAPYDLIINDTYLTPNLDSAGFTKIGDGTLQFTGKQVQTGGTSTIKEGAVAIDGKEADGKGFVGNITVTDNLPKFGTLQGIGTITGNVAITNTGHLAPGNGVGQLSVIGDVNFGPTSTIDVELNPNFQDLLAVTGNVVIQPGATFNLLPSNVSYPTDYEYTIISATGSVSGAFTNFIFPMNQSATFTGSLKHSVSRVFLKQKVAPFTTVLPPGNNGGEMGGYWDCVSMSIPIGSTAPIATLINDLHMGSLTQLQDAAEQTSPVAIKGLALSQQANSFAMRGKISDRGLKASHRNCRGEGRESNISNLWGDIGYNHTNQESKPEQPGFKNDTVNAIIGLDYESDASFLFGAALGYSHTHASFNKNRGDGSIDSGYASLYLHGYNNYAFADLTLMGAVSHYTEHRNIHFVTGTALYDKRSNASFNGAEILAHAGFGLIGSWNTFEARPFIGVDYLGMNQNAFKEDGADVLDLFINKSRYSMVRGEAGLKFSLCVPRDDYRTTIDGSLSYIREQRLKGKSYTGRYRDTRCSFTVDGIYPNRDLFAPGIGVTVRSLDESTTLNLRYEGEFGHSYSNNAINLALSRHF